MFVRVSLASTCFHLRQNRQSGLLDSILPTVTLLARNECFKNASQIGQIAQESCGNNIQLSLKDKQEKVVINLCSIIHLVINCH